MKIYIAFIDEGSWDSWIKYVDKVFSTKEAADEYAENMNKDMASKKSSFPKDPSDLEDENLEKLEKEFGGVFDEEKYKIMKDEYDKFRKEYDGDPYKVLEFNKCIVEEFEVQ